MTQSCTYIPLEEICTPDWQCSTWSPSDCPESEVQTRTCLDANNCGTMETKPYETQLCTFGSVCGDDRLCESLESLCSTDLPYEEFYQCILYEASKMSCLDELGGYICEEGYNCQAQIVSAADTNNCCMSPCISTYECTEEERRALADSDIETHGYWSEWSNVVFLNFSEYSSTRWFYRYCGEIMGYRRKMIVDINVVDNDNCRVTARAHGITSANPPTEDDSDCI